ncbi:Hypothetical protein CINCED_3A017666 [Cinara cedri]|uniref:Uncharacterized protein n=1 Tax=Cinara cedri TaxID=506608 RepID=A0A5E4MS97_9HEMI|nr:Hypothetical protein CINCED_3A017666 [Cinara cedri]
MLKTCFGCCSLRRGASCIAIFNILWNVLEIFKHGIHRKNQYGKLSQKRIVQDFNNSDENSTYNDYSLEIELVPVMNGLFMDYVFITCVSWIVMELIANIGLKQSTYKLAVHKIYIWLVIYYGNIIFMILHLCYYEINNIKLQTFDHYTNRNHNFGAIEHKLIYTAIVIFEIFIIHSYYIVEEKAALQNFIKIKWKYVSKGEVMSSGVDYPSASNFTALTSRQTQEGSRIPPYITRVAQD